MSSKRSSRHLETVARAEGTVKAYLSAVFRAAGVATRNELQGLFMDEFLDFGAVAEAGVQKVARMPAAMVGEPAT